MHNCSCPHGRGGRLVNVPGNEHGTPAQNNQRYCIKNAFDKIGPQQLWWQPQMATHAATVSRVCGGRDKCNGLQVKEAVPLPSTCPSSVEDAASVESVLGTLSKVFMHASISTTFTDKYFKCK